MGTPVVPGEKGVDCPGCTPDFWAPGQTPKYVMVMFTRITKGLVWQPGDPEPPNGEFVLTQVPGVPCLWTRLDDYFKFEYDIRLGASTLEIFDGHWLPAFRSVETIPCWEYFHSSLAPPGGWRYNEGDGFIDLYDFPGTAYQLLHDYNLAPTEYTRFDVLPVPDGPPYVQVRRFGNVRTPTNIKIKTDATHKDQYEMFEK
ncbi:hypothetical protein ES703_100096 [subsurface metagenome]